MLIDSKTLFFYVVIFIAIVFVFSKFCVGLNVVFGTLIATVFIWFLYMNYKHEIKEEIKIESAQQELIIPDPEMARGYDEVMRHLFSIQDFYHHNPQAYAEMINGFKNFFRIYEDTYIVPRYAGRNYEMMVDQKRKSMNALHSVIFKLPHNDLYEDKLERGIIAIERVLQKYLDNVEYIQKLYLYTSQYNVETKLIDKSGILPRNAMDGKDVPETYGDRFGHRENSFSYSLF